MFDVYSKSVLYSVEGLYLTLAYNVINQLV